MNNGIDARERRFQAMKLPKVADNYRVAAGSRRF
jgi:hypothetical protein